MNGIDVMSSNTSKFREQAEAAFGKTQTESLARNRTMSEIEAVAAARDEKTARLRELRKAKEATAFGASIK